MGALRNAVDPIDLSFDGGGIRNAQDNESIEVKLLWANWSVTLRL